MNPDTPTPRRGPRRAVRRPGPVGVDAEALRSVLPAVVGAAVASQQAAPQPVDRAEASDDSSAPPPSSPGPDSGPEPDSDQPATARRSRDDSDVGWGRVDDSNDDRLNAERPPHW